MYKNKVHLYSSEDVIEEFYDAIADGDSNKLKRVHIPKSDVFYVREALEARLGKRYTLDHRLSNHNIYSVMQGGRYCMSEKPRCSNTRNYRT